MYLKKLVLFTFIFISAFASAQKVDSMYVNLYTDSLKRGTYNYINIDGLLSNGTYLPLDSTHIILWASDGKFRGNELWLDKNINRESVFIKVVLRQNPRITKEFTMFVKKKPDDDKLPSEGEIINQLKKKNKK